MSVPCIRLLVVDDSLAERRLVHEAVAEFGAGLDLRLAASAEEAESLAAMEPRPDLAVVDLHLGRTCGRDLIHRLGLPVAILSTTDDPAERGLALAAGALAFWVKPLRFAGYRDLLAQAKALALETIRRP